MRTPRSPLAPWLAPVAIARQFGGQHGKSRTFMLRPPDGQAGIASTTASRSRHLGTALSPSRRSGEGRWRRVRRAPLGAALGRGQASGMNQVAPTHEREGRTLGNDLRAHRTHAITHRAGRNGVAVSAQWQDPPPCSSASAVGRTPLSLRRRPTLTWPRFASIHGLPAVATRPPSGGFLPRFMTVFPSSTCARGGPSRARPPGTGCTGDDPG